MARYLKQFKIEQPKQQDIVGVPRLMTTKDIPAVYKLYNKAMEDKQGYFIYTQEEIGHHFVPSIDNVVTTIVIENNNKEVTDFVSFYYLPSTILRDETGHGYKEMNVSFEYFCFINLFFV